ncbi:response regulator [Gorillibacterium sp. sgz500922]|uniref:response regulator n=1 Tax=Gorillibacterium sp. sgz500922 TaxID=3446694 RepID=UPI003F67D9E4
MYKVMIVDDEPAIRSGLASLIDWNTLGFEVTGTAANGREALERYREAAVDLMVVDIRMPGMDGLQLIQEIRRQGGSCHFLILSGYSDFNYAKEAIGLGVDGYILKPVDEEEMAEELRRIGSAMMREMELEKRRRISEEIYRERVLQAIVGGDGELDPSLNLDALFGRTDTGYQVVLIAADLPKGEAVLRQTAVRLAVDGVLRSRSAGFSFFADGYLGILLREALPNGRALTDFYRQLHAALEPGGIRFFASAGGPASDPEGIRASFREAVRVVQSRFLLEGETIHLYREEELGPASGEETPLSEAVLRQMADKLLFALELGQADRVQETVRESGDRIRASRRTASGIKTDLAHVLTLTLNKLATQQPGYASSVKERIGAIPDLLASPTYRELVKEAARQLAGLASEIGNASSAPVIKQITSFIEQHYGENLKLETLAELYNYNSGYLGKLFRSETGESFNTYLDRVRIRHAIELLGSGLKVHQVARLVGYANVDYFHSKFKKYVGESPSTYKGKEGRTHPEGSVRSEDDRV